VADEILMRINFAVTNEGGRPAGLIVDAIEEIEKLRALLRLFVSHEPCEVEDGECVAHGWLVDDVLRCPMAAVSDAVGGCGCG
jgi:hypothetical protein